MIGVVPTPPRRGQTSDKRQGGHASRSRGGMLAATALLRAKKKAANVKRKDEDKQSVGAPVDHKNWRPTRRQSLQKLLPAEAGIGLRRRKKKGSEEEEDLDEWVVEREASQLMKAITASSGLDTLKSFVHDEHRIVITKRERLKRVIGRTQLRPSQIVTANSVPSAGEGQGVARKISPRKRKRVLMQLRKMGQMAIAMRQSRHKAEERLRLQRLDSKWRKVRQIATAALAMKRMTNDSNTMTKESNIELRRKMYKILRKPANNRTEDDLRVLLSQIKQLAFFQDESLSESQLLSLCEVMTLCVLPARHTTLFRQGDQGHYFYVTLSGSFVVTVKSPDGVGSITVAEIKQGDGFGGFALRTSPPGKRSATVLTTEPSEVLQIPAREYKSVILQSEHLRLTQWVSFMDSVPAINHFTVEEKRQLALLFKFTTKTFPIGSVIQAQGDIVHPARFVGIIRHGKCKLVKRINKNGTCLPPSELVRIHESEKTFLECLKSWHKDHASGSGHEHKTSTAQRSKFKNVPRVEDYIAVKFPRVASINLGMLGPKHIVGDASMLKMDTKERHDLSVYADTVVQIVFLERKSLSEILSKESLELLKRKLPTYPDVQQLYETHVERVHWDRFRRRTLQNNLKVSFKGEKFLRLRKEAQQDRAAVADISEERRRDRSSESEEREGERNRHFVRIKAQARMKKDGTCFNEEQLPETIRPALLSIDHADAFVKPPISNQCHTSAEERHRS